MVSTRNTSRSNTNPPRMQDPPGDMSSRPPGTVEAMQANTNEVEALRLANQRLVEELERLTRQIQHPRETRQTQEDHNLPPREEQLGHDIPEASKQRQSPAEPGGMDHRWPQRRRKTKQYPGGSSGTKR